MLSGQVLGFDFLNFQVYISWFLKNHRSISVHTEYAQFLSSIHTMFLLYCFFLAALMKVCLWKTVEYTSQIQMLRYDFIKESAPI